MKNQYYLRMFIIAIMVAAVASYCSKGSSYGSSNSSGSNTNTGTGTNAVTMQNMSFSPTSLTVTKGTTVTWTNNDNTTHTVTADDNSFNSGDITAGHTYSRTFNTAGTFAYHCIYHSMMKASVVVN
jgi:plastocyanin